MKNEDLIVSVETMNRQLSHFGIFQAFAAFVIAVLPLEDRQSVVTSWKQHSVPDIDV